MNESYSEAGDHARNVVAGVTATSAPWLDIKRAWHAYVEDDIDPHLSAAVRPEIADSWTRCRAFGVSPDACQLSSAVSDDDFDRILDVYAPLIEITKPLIGIIDELGIANDYIFELVARNGASLLSEGGLDLHPFVRDRDIFNEATMGTNAHSLCMLHKKPLQVVGYEHYCAPLHGLAAGAAPIMDENGVVIAALLLTQPLPHEPEQPLYHKLLSHALGLITSIASAIEYQMSFAHASADLQDMGKKYSSIAALSIRMRRMLDSTIDSSTDPIMITDTRGVVQKISPEAARIMGRSPSDVVKATVESLFGVSWPDVFGPLLTGKRSVSVHTTLRGRPYVLRGMGIKDVGVEKSGKLEGILLRLEERTRSKDPTSQATGDRADVTFKGILGESSEIAAAITRARRYAVTAENVLITGESGTGKELFAQAIHNESRADGPFMSINCAAIPPRLIESELFGYESGAFTGAERGGKPGKIELADGGTLFLDEIGDMPLELQATLLRVLENKRVMRLGGKAYKQVDFRVVAATNRDLSLMVEKGSFREDLLYRLSILTVELPPLRERAGDTAFFARYFLNECRCKSSGGPSDFSPEALALVEHYTWPGNVRQLKNAVYSMYYAADGDTVCVDDFSPQLLRMIGAVPDSSAASTTVAAPTAADIAVVTPVAAVASAAVFGLEDRACSDASLPQELVESASPNTALTAIEESEESLSMADAELAVIKLAMKVAKGNVKEASLLLGISKATLYRKLKDYGLA